MKHCVAVVAVSLTVGLAGCDDRNSMETGPVDEVYDVASDTLPVNRLPLPAEAGEAIPGAPGFVVMYPGAEPHPTEAGSGTREIIFVTDAAPDTVVEYYRQRAESSGLRTTAAMNQGQARAYGAADLDEVSGNSLQVVASPTEDGRTSVQLNWSGKS